MIVAARAGYRETQEGLGKDIDLIVDAICLILQRIDRSVSGLVQVPEPGREH